MNAITRTPPPPLEHLLLPCSLCGEDVEYDDGAFYCIRCGATWDGEFSHLDGHSSWDDATLPQCPATIRPHAGSITHPRLAAVVERCLLTKGHDPGRHRNGEEDWTDEDADGYITAQLEGLRPTAAIRGALVRDLIATAHASAEALGIPAT